MQSAVGQYAEALALICARHAQNVVFLPISATISGLISNVPEQINTAQPSLEQHIYAWTGVLRSFLYIFGGRVLLRNELLQSIHPVK